MVIYDSSSIYIEEAQTLKDKITRMDAVLGGLEDTLLKAAAGDNVEEYSIDNGQTKIKTINRSVGAISRSIQAIDKLKQMYINRLNGRGMTLVDGGSFRR